MFGTHPFSFNSPPGEKVEKKIKGEEKERGKEKEEKEKKKRRKRKGKRKVKKEKRAKKRKKNMQGIHPFNSPAEEVDEEKNNTK